MSLLHEAIQDKKFDTRMIDKNLVRNVISDKDVKTAIESLPDDGENASYITLDEVSEQK